MRQTYSLVNDAMKSSAAKAKQRYDMKVRGAVPEVGDQVLVKLVGLVGKQKLANKWETEPYTVVDIPDKGMPVFVVQRSTGQGPKRTLHRNMLLPLALPLVERRQTEDGVKDPKKDTEGSRPMKMKTRSDPKPPLDSSDDSSDEDHS